MSSLPEATRSLVQVFNGKLQEFTNEIENIHMVWLEEIQQEAKRMFSRYTVQIWLASEVKWSKANAAVSVVPKYVFITVQIDLCRHVEMN